MRKEHMDAKLGSHGKRAKYGADQEDQPRSGQTDGHERTDSRYTDHGADPREEWSNPRKRWSTAPAAGVGASGSHSRLTRCQPSCANQFAIATKVR